MSEYIEIVAPDAVIEEPFRFELAGKKFELPKLTEKTAPLELLPVLMVAGNEDVTDREKIAAGAAFLEYLHVEHIGLWRHIKKQPNSVLWLNGLLEQWVKGSGFDPKA